jgi:hypothetical protein
MPKYRVNLFYHASASYDVEMVDEESAIEEAHRLAQLDSPEEFYERLNLDFTDSDVYEDKEE